MSGGLREPIITALNTSTYSAINMPAQIGNVAIYTEDETGFYVATDSGGTGEALIPTGKLSIERLRPKDGVAMYAKAVSGTPNLVLLFNKSI